MNLPNKLTVMRVILIPFFVAALLWDGGYSDPNQIGKKISHGCIRLLEENAKWIYFNASYGTTVVTI